MTHVFNFTNNLLKLKRKRNSILYPIPRSSPFLPQTAHSLHKEVCALWVNPVTPCFRNHLLRIFGFLESYLPRRSKC